MGDVLSPDVTKKSRVKRHLQVPFFGREIYIIDSFLDWYRNNFGKIGCNFLPRGASSYIGLSVRLGPWFGLL